MRLQGHTFGVIINQECSGLEGVGLMLVFSAAWLWLFRADLRFPRAYLLVPVGVVTLYLLNAVRIAALLLIGDAGAQRIAAGGFHSQAGWIAFNGVALAMTLIVPRIAWFAQRPQIRTIPEAQGENPTAAYLMPFLAILASGMLSRAASADFEWLYSLRFVAALTALWIFKRRLVSLDWRFGASGVLAGVVVFGMWLAFDRWQAIPVATMPFALEASSPTARSIWIVFRALAATTTVPIAEELAFRGFLMRRVSSADFEALPLRSSTWLGILISSIVFGMLHGDRWIAGILAGLIFALVARHTNRIGDAFVGHAFANALLSVWVLYLGQWQYW
jgi:exosortase E/protease (VPEID-CTERM system)